MRSTSPGEATRVGAQLQRSLTRMCLIGARRCRVFKDCDEAIAWLTTELTTHGMPARVADWQEALVDARRWPLR